MLGQNVDGGVADSPRLEISERQDSRSRRIDEYRKDRLDREAVQLTRPGRRDIPTYIGRVAVRIPTPRGISGDNRERGENPADQRYRQLRAMIS